MDDEGRLRLDAHELEPALQSAIAECWSHDEPGAPPAATAAGFARFKVEYMNLYGWEVEGIDYEAPAEFEPALVDGERVIDLIGD